MNCQLCGAEEFLAWGRVNDYSIKRCAVCGLGVTTPFPLEETLAEVNDDTYRVELRIATYLDRRSLFEKRYRESVARIRKLGGKGKLLDIGCNIGLFLTVARDAGFKVAGVELNSGCAAYGRETFGLDIHNGYLETAGYPDASFDIVTLFDVVEHVPGLHQFLSEVGRILTPGGMLVVQSPNIDSTMASLTRSSWNWLTPPDHLYHFTPRTMSDLLTRNGFNVVLLRTWEPASEFTNNLLALLPGKSLFIRLAQKVLRLSRVIEYPVWLLQRLWWSRQRGALLEVYARKGNVSR